MTSKLNEISPECSHRNSGVDAAAAEDRGIDKGTD